MRDDYLREIRLAELAAIRHLLPASPASVLEVGAGAGWMAGALADAGYTVTAVDIKTPATAEGAFPVGQYDGRVLPYAAQHFDVVFTSHVVAHVEDLPQFFSEVKRVLKPGGCAVHLCPTTTWRLWTCVSRALQIPINGAKRFTGTRPRTATSAENRAAPAKRSLRLLWAFPLSRHWSTREEFHRFSRRGWIALFADFGFAVGDSADGTVFYSGSRLLGTRWSLASRRGLARWFGSSSIAFCTRASEPGR